MPGSESGSVNGSLQRATANYGSIQDPVPPHNENSQINQTSQLSEKITSNIYLINTRRKDLEQNLKTIGTPKDSQEMRSKVPSKLLSANEIVDETTKDLNKLTLFTKKGDKRQKLQVEKLMANFKEAVQMYSRVQKQVAEKMRRHILPSEQALLDDMSSQNEGRVDSENDHHVFTKQLEFEQGLLQEREQRMQNIESCILDINQIMKEIGAMVHEQGDNINSIEVAIETAHGTVEAGQTELEKAAIYQARRRKKTCYLLGISVAVGIVLAVIITISFLK